MSIDLVWLETPKNPACEVYDIAAYAALATVVVDGTFAPPPMQRALAEGATIVMHSTTKYLSGHTDALGGALHEASEACRCLRNLGLF